MTAFPRIKLRCDWPNCLASFDGYGTKITEARAAAAKRGWKAVSVLDLCGSRDQAEPFTGSYELSQLQGHAAREDHFPVIGRGRGKGYISLSCKGCGWKVPSQFSWDVAGECTRGSADIRWAEHIKEIERSQQQPIGKA